MKSRIISTFLLLTVLAFANVCLGQGQSREDMDTQFMKMGSVILFIKDDGSDFRKDIHMITEEQKRILDEVFKLEDKEVTAFLIRKMNMEPYQGRMSSHAENRRAILAYKKHKGLKWMIKHIQEFSATGRKSMVECLSSYRSRESYQILLKMLEDKITVPMKYFGESCQYSPIAFGNPHYRVCDYAYNALSTLLAGEKKKELNSIKYDDNLKKRDVKISNLMAYLKGQGKARLMNRYSILNDKKVDQESKASIASHMANLKKKLKAKPKKLENVHEENTPVPKKEEKGHDKRRR